VYLYPGDNAPLQYPPPDLIQMPGVGVEAEVLSVANDGLSMKVQMPGIPVHSNNWYWVVNDHWVRPGYSSREKWLFHFGDAEPPYPQVWGFGFHNFSEDPHDVVGTFYGAYGDNAYVCLGAFGYCGCSVPDPIYALYLPIFYPLRLNLTGNCAGFASTSLRVRRGDFQASGWNADVFTSAGLDSTDNLHESFDYDWCGPARPETLRATIMTQQTKILSAEMLDAILDDIGDGGAASSIFNWDYSVLQGHPADRVRDLEQGELRRSLVCMFPDDVGDMGDAHCVVPYEVVRSGTTAKIRISDSNKPWYYDQPDTSGDNKKALEAAIDVDMNGDTYSYGSGTLHGTRLTVIPLELFRHDVHMPGLTSLARFAWVWAIGSAEPVVIDATGGRIGKQADGSVRVDYDGAGFAPLPDLGGMRPILLPTVAGSPKVDLRLTGEESTFHVSAGGRVVQMLVQNGHAGDVEKLDITASDDGELRGLKYVAKTTGTRVSPRFGMSFADREVATFQWSPIALATGKDVEIMAAPATRGATLVNRSGATRTYDLVVSTVDGATSTSGTYLFAGITATNGAAHRASLSAWPDGSRATLAVDATNDGRFESSVQLTGIRCDLGGTVTGPDCNGTHLLDRCDIASATSKDASGNGVPDECSRQQAPRPL
jgi:hypothetical protein